MFKKFLGYLTVYLLFVGVLVILTDRFVVLRSTFAEVVLIGTLVALTMLAVIAAVTKRNFKSEEQ